MEGLKFRKGVNKRVKELILSISDYTKKCDFKIFCIGFTVVFDQGDNAEILVGICQEKEVDSWVRLYGKSAKYYVWNTAEYECFEAFSIGVTDFFEGWGSRDRFLSELREWVNEIRKMYFDKDVFWFVHDVEDDDFCGFLILTNEDEKIMALRMAELI
ncbi:hypothetical protein [Motilimonas sp. E26]|uniref:hypothetical protein n=1 Tax=Motilimonas sp. E26 TaxID=2865674 RepID=UPI001E508B48|nr:hypothetical protein [Motilimonas sp. E26]MCE0559443.1 hypothetical protein [Motilimonas sp. E26]